MDKRVQSARGVWLLNCALLGGVLLCCGCPPPIDANSHEPGAAITPRRLWRAYGDLRDPGLAIDGDLLTAAVSGNSYTGAHLDIDLGKACTFNRIVVEHGTDEYGFPNRMAVLTSFDGRSFTPLTQVPGKRRVTNVLLIGPVLARYVRLQAISPGARPWSVAEVWFQ